LTGTGMGIGTPEYMAPEQWTGKTSPLSDQYALGVVLYEMLTGSLPYSGENLVAFSRGTLPNLKAPKPSIGNPSIHPKLENIIMRAISPRKKDRFVSATAFAYALAQIAKKSMTYKKREVDWLLVTFLVLLGAAAVIAYQFYILFHG